jgi:predicted small secreted protein
MRRYRWMFFVISLVLLAGSLIGCDNRTGFEKGVDNTASKIKDIAR